MPKSPPNRLTRSAVLIALAGLMCGCVSQAKPGVQVQVLGADLVFAASPKAPRSGAAPANVPAYPQQLPGIPIEPVPDLAIPTDVLGPPLRSDSPCPVAGPNVFPREAAGLTVPAGRLPVPGQYEWRRSGTRQGPDTLNIALPIAGFERRVVKNVKKISATEFQYETVQPELLSTDRLTYTWLVKTAGTSQASPGAQGLPAASVGDPERGIVLRRIVRQSVDGKITSIFAPPVGALLLPLPVRPNEQFTSVSIDPVSQQTLVFQGSVRPSVRLNACGEVVEAWPVKGTLTSGGAGGGEPSQVTYTAYFAPQLGAMLVGEHLEVLTGSGTTVKADLTIGQLTPDARPAGR